MHLFQRCAVDEFESSCVKQRMVRVLNDKRYNFFESCIFHTKLKNKKLVSNTVLYPITPLKSVVFSSPLREKKIYN